MSSEVIRYDNIIPLETRQSIAKDTIESLER